MLRVNTVRMGEITMIVYALLCKWAVLGNYSCLLGFFLKVTPVIISDTHTLLRITINSDDWFQGTGVILGMQLCSRLWSTQLAGNSTNTEPQTNCQSARQDKHPRPVHKRGSLSAPHLRSWFGECLSLLIFRCWRISIGKWTCSYDNKSIRSSTILQN